MSNKLLVITTLTLGLISTACSSTSTSIQAGSEPAAPSTTHGPVEEPTFTTDDGIDDRSRSTSSLPSLEVPDDTVDDLSDWPPTTLSLENRNQPTDAITTLCWASKEFGRQFPLLVGDEEQRRLGGELIRDWVTSDVPLIIEKLEGILPDVDPDVMPYANVLLEAFTEMTKMPVTEDTAPVDLLDPYRLLGEGEPAIFDAYLAAAEKANCPDPF